MRAKRLSVRAECCLCTRVVTGDLPSDAFSFALQIQTVHVASEGGVSLSLAALPFHLRSPATPAYTEAGQQKSAPAEDKSVPKGADAELVILLPDGELLRPLEARTNALYLRILLLVSHRYPGDTNNSFF